ncbi:MAG: DUF4339 domain-containing protein [Verrucomicrobia bacterium]|nr:DUF4339 domain-containing protein [Verrucomicrobiota bacterium]
MLFPEKLYPVPWKADSFHPCKFFRFTLHIALITMDAMSQIHIARHGQSLGAFTEEEIKEGIQSRRFVGDDLSWRSGMSEWLPLKETVIAWGLDAVPATSLTGADEMPLMSEPAWERRAEVGFFKAIVQTISAVLCKPGTTFSKLKVDGGLMRPLFYYLLMSAVTFGVVLCYQLPSILKNPTLLSSALEGVSPRTLLLGFGIIWILSPLFFTGGIFISSFLTHLSLKIIAKTKEPFQATFRTMCYAVGSASITQLIPFVGGIVSAIWGVIIYFIGLKKVHRISGGRLFFSVFLSVVLFVLFYLVIIVLASVAMGVFAGHPPVVSPAK